VPNRITVEGVHETQKAFDGLGDDLKPGGAVTELGGNAVAELLAPALVAAAAASGVPVAPAVAASVRVQAGTRPAVSIGGSQRVGRYGAPAYKLVWGSEHGPASDPNHFAVAPGPGYWIKPAVDRVAGGSAPFAFELAIAGRIRRHGL